MDATQALATTSHTADEVVLVASINRSTGDYVGTRIHLATCGRGKCGEAPRGWHEVGHPLTFDMGYNRVNTVVAPCAAA